MTKTQMVQRRMAQSEKITGTHINIPSSIEMLIKVFSMECEYNAKALIILASDAIYSEKHKDSKTDPKPISKQDVDAVYALINGIKPVGTLESLYAAQIVVGHMLGMRKLNQSCEDDQRLGLRLLRLSNDAMTCLEKTRNDGHHNINLTLENTVE